MSFRGASCLVLSALDDVAWTFNLRGSDITFNPVFFAYAAITAHEAHLFISEKQVRYYPINADLSENDITYSWWMAEELLRLVFRWSGFDSRSDIRVENATLLHWHISHFVRAWTYYCFISP
jgi:hypothetical protein